MGRSPAAASPKDDDATPVKEEDDREAADLASGHSMPTGLAAIAEAAEHASPFSSELKVSCCTTQNNLDSEAPVSVSDEPTSHMRD